MNLWLLGAQGEAERILRQITLPDEEASYASLVRPFCLAWLLAERGATHAAIHLARGRHAEARAVVEAAVAKAASVGVCSFFSRDGFLRLTHAECLEAVGDRVAARAAIASAQQWVLGVAEKIRDPDLRDSFLHQVPENRTILASALRWATDV